MKRNSTTTKKDRDRDLNQLKIQQTTKTTLAGKTMKEY